MVNVIAVFYVSTSFLIPAIYTFPEVKIHQGRLQGVYDKTWKGRPFSAFLGIPYSEPPIGNLRFKPPVPAAAWEGVFDASKEAPICPQIEVFFNVESVVGNEDCLYLNVHTPLLAFGNKQQLLPVMYYIHGGAYSFGSGNPSICGANVLLDKDVVFVTSNYRLGPLGFLSTGDAVVPGNNGLKDQNMAIRWIKDNIQHFGGDPEKITIVGLSAGGVSAHYHTLSTLSKDLIRGVILHSGTTLAPWALAPSEQTVTNTKQLANLFNCTVQSNEEMIQCLKKVDSHDMIAKDNFFKFWNNDPIIPFKPVIEPNIEGAFLTEHPVDIIKSGKAANVPVMTGITTQEGQRKTAELYSSSQIVKELNKNFDKYFSYFVNCNETEQDEKMLSAIRQFYFANHPIDSSTKSQLTDFFTDIWFLMPEITAIKLYQKYTKIPVYAFVFGYRGSLGMSGNYGDPSFNDGVAHGDDVMYIVNSKVFESVKLTESDYKIIEVLTNLWANFAETGNPTPELNNIIKTKWNAIIEGDGKISHYSIKKPNEIEMADELYSERINFWESFTYPPMNAVKEEL